MNKKIAKETLSVPAIFQKKEEYSVKDIRFTKVKIWLMHIGINENGSCFDKEYIEKAIPTLANTPILGYIEENRKGDKDFSDHRHGFVTEDGKRKFKYLGSAYGVIPESHNARFEKRLCDDGIEREFLVVDGLMWNKLEDGVDILSKFGFKGQSMELDDENFDGYFDENNIFHFTDFIFYGACLLGIDSEPAMINSTVEVEFCKGLKNEIRNKLEVFNEYVKGGASVNEEEKYKEEVKEEEVKTEHTSEEDEKVKSEEEEVKTEHTSEEDEKVKSEEEVKTEHTSEEDDEESKSEEEDEEKINFQTEYETLKIQYEQLKNEFSQLKNENIELSEFKKSALKETREKEETTLFEKYDADLGGIAEYEQVKAKASEFTSVKELEKEIALVFAQNVKKSFTKEVSTRAYFENDNSATNSRYGYLAEKYK